MKICVIGTGYVGLVTGACLADLGNEVICVDKVRSIVSSLSAGKIHFYEPGLREVVLKNKKLSRLSFTIDIPKAARLADVIFIAVGTPAKKNGEADISAVKESASQISKALKDWSSSSKDGYKVIVNKSTVPVGMGDIVTDILCKQGIDKHKFTVVSNPEFLREGSAISDFMHPDRIVIGSHDNRAFNVITDLYRPLNAHIIFTSVKSAELIKYASNAFLATKISFINEIANICEQVGGNVEEVADAMGLDKRIGRAFLNAGIGYGGSCFPKDVAALEYIGKTSGYAPRIISAVSAVNQAQIKRFISKIKKTLGSVKGKKMGVLGLSFKPNTDDLREAPSLQIIDFLIKNKAKISLYDPAASAKIKRKFKGVRFTEDVYQAASGADVLIIITEWNEFQELDFSRLKKIMARPLIIDGRNIFTLKQAAEAGFSYVSVGRPSYALVPTESGLVASEGKA